MAHSTHTTTSRGLTLFVAVLLAAAAPVIANGEALTNVATREFGATASADTAYGPPYDGSYAIDGLVQRGDGCWFSADQSTLPCALTIDLGRALKVSRVALYQASWNDSMYHTKDVVIEVSSDGAAWTEVAQSTLPDESEVRVEIAFEAVTARHVRIAVVSSYIDFQTCGLAEVEVMAEGVPYVTRARLALGGEADPPISDTFCDLAVAASETGPQVALMPTAGRFAAAMDADETVSFDFAVVNAQGPATLRLQAECSGDGRGELDLLVGDALSTVDLSGPQKSIELSGAGENSIPVRMVIRAAASAFIRVSDLWIDVEGQSLPILLPEGPGEVIPPPLMPELRPAIADTLIEWDWRMGDGIGTPRMAVSFAEAAERTIERGRALATDLRTRQADVGDALRTWRAACRDWEALSADERDGPTGEAAWLDLHWAKRALTLANPLADTGSVLFAKCVPSAFSHQLTQYYGRYARPGGGLFILDKPGRSTTARELATGELPVGSILHPEVSYDGQRIIFAFAEAPTVPVDTFAGQHGRYYHLYEVAPDGTGLRQLTDGAFDDFSPRELPDGKLMFISTRRLGWHRCGTPGCENYTLAVAQGDGSDPHSVSYHETQEWDPAVLNDGRVVYTRWDYVDRHAVFYEQLWSVGPDGSSPAALYGNNTLNPVGVWEARAIPGSTRIMATAAAHHAMTAGSIILVDPAMGVDGPEPIKRLTPDAPFPESESTLLAAWRAPIAGLEPYNTIEQDRWPGHCYRSPHPLSEDYFLAAYSYEPLVGEPQANSANMFGLYLVDSFGNREMLYRDLNIGSLWPTPIAARPRPPKVDPSAPNAGETPMGAFIIQNVRNSFPQLPESEIEAIRIVQLLPKSTSGANNPTVGLANASPGKQVLGTVPVEDDGSCAFEAPAGIPLAFQALDSRGRAVQVMRSVTYLQPGQTLACVGCHEPRSEAPPNSSMTAMSRPLSTIKPGPEGSKPLSYPILVQPVLDRNCINCHGAEEPAGGVQLTGEPAGRYSVSYNALAPRVSIAQWLGGMDFTELNSEPLAKPDFFGSRASSLADLLLAGHHDVALSEEDWERMVTWMDANALFYGTFDPADQALQQQGLNIAGPALE